MLLILSLYFVPPFLFEGVQTLRGTQRDGRRDHGREQSLRLFYGFVLLSFYAASFLVKQLLFLWVLAFVIFPICDTVQLHQFL